MLLGRAHCEKALFEISNFIKIIFFNGTKTHKKAFEHMIEFSNFTYFFQNPTIVLY